MRLNKFFLVTLLALSTTLLQSCLKDQEDIFDEPSNVRVQAYLDEAKKVLTSSENGWAFDYYPDADIAYGGFVYTVKFDAGKVVVGCELAPGEFETSLYKLGDDNGPILSFDSYNSLMHYFSTPSSGNYQAYDGDFEFMIMDITDDLITLRGKRTGNAMYLHRLTQDATSYLNSALEVDDNICLTEGVNGTIGGVTVKCEIDQEGRHIDFIWGEGDDNKAGSYYVPTATGVYLCTPLQIGSETITHLAYNAEKHEYTAVSTEGNSVTLTGRLPLTYSYFDDYEGNYTIYYNPAGEGVTGVDVTFVADRENNRYIIKGINDNYDVVATYVKSRGALEICSQQVTIDQSNGRLIWFCGWGINPATGSGSITWNTGAGMYIVKDIENEGTYNFTSNGYLVGGYPVNSFAAYYFTGTVGGTPRGQAASKWRVKTGDGYQMTYIDKMVKR